MILITASLSAVYQYFDVKQENRVKKTMEFLDNFNSGALQSAQLNLSKTCEIYHDEIVELQINPVASEKERELIIEDFVLSIVSHHQQEQDIGLVVSFLENLQICVENRICDEKVSRVFFGEYAVSFYNLYAPWFKKKRKIILSYACELQSYVQQDSCDHVN